jgi:peroxiredoxin
MITASSCLSQNDGLKTGDVLPNPVITLVQRYDYDSKPVSIPLYEYKEEQIMLVAVMPEISNLNISAKIITTGLNAYFAEALSFRIFEKYRWENPKLKVLVITNNSEGLAKEFMNKYDLNFDVVADEQNNIANYFGINKWKNPGDDSHIYLVDGDNKIIYARNDYRGEGEKLKELQSNVFTVFGLTEELTGENKYPLLVQGDDARDFDFSYANLDMAMHNPDIMRDGKLSDYIGKKNVLLAFYPAPYSYSCSAEVTRFDTFAEEQLIQRVRNSNPDELEVLMVSVSNSYILTKWKNDLGLENVKLISDETGEISMKYNSYNTLGWNKRTVFLINKEGKVQYIDWDYRVDDEEDFGVIKEQLTATK